MKINGVFLFVLLAATLHAATSIEPETALFSSSRSLGYVWETYEADIAHSLSLQVSTDEVVLSSGVSQADLPNGAYVCPGEISAQAVQSLDSPVANLNDFSVVAPNRLPSSFPPSWGSNLANIEIQESTDSFFPQVGPQTLVSPLANQVFTNANRDVNYVINAQSRQDGAAKAGIICTGSTEISVSGSPTIYTFPQNALSTQDYSAPSNPQFTAKLQTNNCKGIVEPLDANKQSFSELIKYVYSNPPISSQPASQIPHTTQYTPSITLHVRDPAVGATAAITNPTGTVNMNAGASIPVTFTLINSQASEPRKIRLTGISANNGFSFSLSGLPSSWINAGSSQQFTGTLTAPNNAFIGTVAISLALETDGIVCSGNIPTPTLLQPLVIENVIVTPVQQPDLIVQNAGPITTAPAQGSTLHFDGQVKNQGSAATSGTFQTCLYIDDVQQTPAFAIASLLAPNAQADVDFDYTVNFAPETEHTWRIKADCLPAPNGVIAEGIHENNNEQSGTFTVSQLVQGKNLRITSVLLPESPEVGQSPQITATVENNGIENVGETFCTRLTLTSPSGSVQTQEMDLTGLASGESQALVFALPIQLPAGENEVNVFTDCNLEVSESNENDNAWDGSFVSIPPTGNLPNLIPQVIPANVPPYICPGDTIEVGFYVINDGEADTNAPFLSTFTVAKPTGLISSYSQQTTQPVIAGSGTPDYLFSYTIGGEGTYTMTATADVNNAIYESNEFDNVDSDSFEVTDKPELIISSYEYSPIMPISGDTFTLTVEVSNIGCQDIPAGANTALASSLSGGGQGGEWGATLNYTGGLARDESHTYNYDSFQLSDNFIGVNSLQMEADPQNLIDEIDETNNLNSTQVLVGSSTQQTCFIILPSSPRAPSLDFSDASVLYSLFTPPQIIDFSCGNEGDTTHQLACEGNSCFGENVCVYPQPNTYTARVANPASPICEKTIVVDLNAGGGGEEDGCNYYI